MDRLIEAKYKSGTGQQPKKRERPSPRSQNAICYLALVFSKVKSSSKCLLVPAWISRSRSHASET